MSSSNANLRVVASGELPPGVSIHPWQPAVGATVSGLRYDGEALPDNVQETLRTKLFERGVLIFEPGTVTARNFTKFVEFLGDYVSYDGPHTPRPAENPDATMIDSTRDKFLRNHIWHVDGGFRKVAPTFTALFAHTLPEHGGDTIFSNTTLAYEQLDPLFRAYLDSLTVIQSADATGHLQDRYFDPLKLAEKRAEFPPHETSLVLEHPVTGRKSLNVNESYTSYIQGLTRVASQNILGILFDAIKAPEVTGRVSWHQGALAVWDNRVVQHKGIKDYGGGKRLLYRTTLV